MLHTSSACKSDLDFLCSHTTPLTLSDNDYSEPNGDYNSWCWLSGGLCGDQFCFNDHNCNYVSRKYFCMTKWGNGSE